MKRGGFKKPTLERKPVPPYTLTRAVTQAAKALHGPQPKQPAWRSRALLDLAHLVTTCQNCERHVEHGCEPAHANVAEWGKGMSRKADDWAHAALCHDCHAWLDQGFGNSPCGQYKGMDRREMWTRAHFRTFSHYWREGWLKVAA